MTELACNLILDFGIHLRRVGFECLRYSHLLLSNKRKGSTTQEHHCVAEPPPGGFNLKDGFKR